MELISLFLLAFGVGFSGAMMPGPLLAVDIAETPRHGWTTGPIICIGHGLAEIAIVVVLAWGFVALDQNQTLARVIAIVGGVALLIMGSMMAGDALRNRIAYSGEKPQRGSRRRLAAKGIVATLSNPFWFVWWATTGLALVVKSMEAGRVGAVVFYFGHVLSDFVWYTVVSILLWRGRNPIVGKGLRILILLCAAFLLYLGVIFILDGING